MAAAALLIAASVIGGAVIKNNYSDVKLSSLLGSYAPAPDPPTARFAGSPFQPQYPGSLNYAMTFNTQGKRDRTVVWWDDAQNPDNQIINSNLINGSHWDETDTNNYLRLRTYNRQCRMNPLFNNGLKHNRDAPNPVYQWVSLQGPL